MKDKLEVVEDRPYEYRIAWFLAEEQDYGAYLGAWPDDTKLLDEEKDPDSRDHIAASIAVHKLNNWGRNSRGYFWESRSLAQKALAAANAAIKADRLLRDKKCIGWPEWAVTALSNGWKAPKGWKP